jgi:PAS domain S-box-containing protein
MLEMLLEGCQVIGFDWRYLYVNDTASMHGRMPKAELIGRTMQDVYPGIESTPMYTALRRTMVLRTPTRFENQFTYPDGHEGWFDLRFVPVPEGVLILSLDITEQKLTEAALRRSEQKYRELFDHARVGMFRLAPDGEQVLDANPKLAEILGVTVESLVQPGGGITWADPERATEFLQQLRERRTIDQAELDIFSASGERKACLMSAAVLPNGSGIEGTLRDISQRISDERQRLKLVAAIHQSAESVVVTDAAGLITYVNPAFERITGYRSDEVVGCNPRILKSGQQDAGYYRELWLALEREGLWRGRMVNRRKDGALYTQESTISRVCDASGEHVGYVAVNRDITGELELEAQLAHAQRMETIGRLTGGIAHDFNNLLSVILGSVEFVLADMPDYDSRRADLEEIRSAGDRAAALTRQLLAFGRRQPLTRETVDFAEVVRRIEPMVRRLVPSDIAVNVQASAEGCAVRADPAQLDQLIMNLVVNARDAMPSGGRLTVTVTTTELDEESFGERAAVKPGRYVRLTISDTGIGMDEVTRARAFEPFFTTKEMGKGTGLGLAMVYGIVHQCGGHIWLYSEPGAGTTIKSYLPCVNPDQADPAALPERTEHVGAGEMLLVVEDEPAVLAITRRVLVDAGYRVLTAADVQEAKQIFARFQDEVGLVLSDVVMPNGGGLALADDLRSVRPDLPILLMSGFADDAVLHRGLTANAYPILGKPFSAAELRQRVREMLPG